jgi:hypothetical protein
MLIIAKVHKFSGNNTLSLRSCLAQARSIFANKEETMLDIILSVSLYIGAIALLVKGAITYCETSNE